MTEADPDVEATDQDEPDDVDEQPEIDDEEMADFGAVADEIEASAGADGDDEPDAQANDSAESEENDQDVPSMDAADSDRVSVGTVYCNGLGMAGAVARTSWGSAEEDDRDDLMDKYAGMAQQLEIDQCVDDWLAEQGGIDELSPGQATIVLTALWMGMVAMDDPDMVSGFAEEVSG